MVNINIIIISYLILIPDRPGDLVQSLYFWFDADVDFDLEIMRELMQHADRVFVGFLELPDKFLEPLIETWTVVLENQVERGFGVQSTDDFLDLADIERVLG